jgi:hypothetical protein
LVIFIEFSASARVLNDDPTMVDGDIGFSAMAEQCLVVAPAPPNIPPARWLAQA